MRRGSRRRGGRGSGQLLFGNQPSSPGLDLGELGLAQRSAGADFKETHAASQGVVARAVEAPAVADHAPGVDHRDEGHLESDAHACLPAQLARQIAAP